jgi:hypothetical protein
MGNYTVRIHTLLTIVDASSKIAVVGSRLTFEWWNVNDDDYSVR